MVVHALWGSEECSVVVWSQGRSQGTTVSASDLRNAQPTSLNPFFNMEYKMIKKIRQNKIWIEVGIPCINLTPNKHKALVPAIVDVSNVTTPFNSMASQ